MTGKALEKKETAAEREKNTYLPAVDVLERERQILLLAEMPGVDEKSIDLTIEEDVLTIRGASLDHRIDGYDVLYAEFEPCAFERSFRISSDIEREKIEAVCKNGILTVTLPKAQRAQPRKIAVKSEK